MVPHLITALNGPINGGWNNLTPEMLPLAVQAAMAAIEKICPEARNLLVVPENHTRNSFYLSNVLQLRRIFNQAGLNVRFGSLSPDIKEPTTLDLPTGESITIEPLIRTDRRLGLKDFDPCTILLNNDLSAGIPGILEDLNEQYLLPPNHASWSVRRKSRHAKAYEEVSKRFGKLLGIDPWLINPMFEKCSEVNIAEGGGMECLTSNVDALLNKIRRKYKEYGINEKPFVIVKAKNKMSTTKDGQPLTEVIIQEGVLTNERVQDAVAEPVVYMMDRYVVGGFYRVHPDRGIDENLNAPGASFVPLAFADSGRLPQPGEKPGSSSPNRFYMYGVIGRLAMLAASYELEATDPDAEVYD